MATKLWNANAIAALIRSEIDKRTLAGKDKDGKPFPEYSTKPFAMPWGAVVNKNKMKKLIKAGKKKGEQNSNVKYFKRKNKSGKFGLWIVFLGGYKVYKKIMRGTDKPNLWMTGTMMKSLKVLKVQEDWGTPIKTKYGDFQTTIPSSTKITIGWSDEAMAKIAEYNIKRKRDVLGIEQEKLDKIVKNYI
jgi:hypothetical protein